MTRLDSNLTVALLAAACFAGCKHADTPTSEPYDSTSYVDPGRPEPSDPEPSAETPSDPSSAFIAGPGGVPLAADAHARTDMAPGGGKMFVFEVPRSRDDAVAELRSNLAADGWTIDSDEVSPGYGAARLKVSKAGATVGVRVTGDDSRAAIIITVP